MTDEGYVYIHGDTYPVKEELKNLGGKWDPRNKCWMVPADQEAKANMIVANPHIYGSEESKNERTG